MDQRTFIFEASVGSERDALEALQTNPLLAAARDEDGVSVITKVAYAGRDDLASELARRRTDLDLFEAACIGEVDVVRQLLGAHSEIIDHHAPDGSTAIGLAARFGHVGLLTFLIEEGADVDAVSANAMQIRPLHAAAAHPNPSRAATASRILLDAGADANAQRNGGYTPLHDAVLGNHIELARLLLGHAANPHVSDDEGDSALQLASATERDSLVELFKETFSA